MAGKLAIVGSGPAGCYLAQAVRKACPSAEISIIDRLPVPYGLVRYGVAADHQGTKSVSRQFARLFERQDIAFLGNLEIGKDLDLEDLRAAMDGVVLATGIYADRRFDAPGAELPNLYGAGEVTRYWNRHPDADGFAPKLGSRVAVFGNGNVAIDLIRLLAKGADDLDGSDFDAAHINDDVTEIHVVGRSPLENARFDAPMVRELEQLDHVAFELSSSDAVEVSDAPVVAALRGLFDRDVSMAKKRVIFHSAWQVEEFVELHGRLAGVTLARGGDVKKIDLDSAVTAIGFTSETPERDRLLTAAENATEGILAPGLYAAGWFKRGPAGTIADNRHDSIAVARHVAAHLNTVRPGKPGRVALTNRFNGHLTDYRDWQAIDAAELAAAPEGRCRAKMSSYGALFDTIKIRRQMECK
ncbi:MAG: FAD-dependent oxidoreductase [Pseudomonadota bacterium]